MTLKQLQHRLAQLAAQGAHPDTPVLIGYQQGDYSAHETVTDVDPDNGGIIIAAWPD